MAQTKKKRRRKHRGTQGGRIDTRPRRSRPRSRQEARAQARTRRKTPGSRFERPPTWRSAATRGLVAAGIFVALLLLVFRSPVGQALAFGAFMLAFYIPAGYFIDSFIWRRRERTRIRNEGK
jgi:Flp pilus assembly protein TadB